MKIPADKTLRFWVAIDLERAISKSPGVRPSKLMAAIFQEYEDAGDASRYLNSQGRLAWKSKPLLKEKLRDQELEAEFDLAG